MGKFLDWLNEKEGKETEYHIFFRKKLEKYNVKSASELSKEDKIKFFSEIEKEWTGDEEDVKKSKEDLEEKKDCNESLVFSASGKSPIDLLDIAVKSIKGIVDSLDDNGKIKDFKLAKKEAKELADKVEEFYNKYSK